MTESYARLRCVKEGSRLRVKIISPGYSPHANCQFPRAIRVEGREYLVPKNDISISDTRGKFFYRVKKNNIQVQSETTADQQDFSNMTVYGDENLAECIICMVDTSENPDLEFVIIAPCGHYCSCRGCASQLRNCPMCRGAVGQLVSRDQLQ